MSSTMTHATPSPCVCGGSAKIMRRLITREYSVGCGRDGCHAATPDFADEPTALRAWNAMQAAVQEGVVGMVPLRWKGEQLMAGACELGTIENDYSGDECFLGYYGRTTCDGELFESDTLATEEAARAALLAHVMGE